MGVNLTDGVVSLRPDVELEEFLDFMWGDQVGYAYVPIKEPKIEDAKWESKFFEWPSEKK